MVVVGVDGCRGGWIGALLDGSSYDVLVAERIGDLLAAATQRAGRPAAVGIDMPIGLPVDRPRVSDALARLRLPRGRKSSVFPTPSRAACEATSHPEASAANRAALGVGLSVQAFHLVPKILEVDTLVGSGPAYPVFEVHPEVSFAAVDPGCVLPSKRTAAGRATRTEALRSVGLDPPAYVAGLGYAPDDLLDACVVAWTAARYAAGEAASLPDPPDVLPDGTSAAIWV